MPLSPMCLICIGHHTFMHPALVINTHTLHLSLTYSFPSTRDPYSAHKLFTYSSASVCANNSEIIMWACWWVRVWCVCVRAPGLWLKARTVTKAISPLILQILRALPIACGSSPLWKALRSPYSSCEVAQTRGHVIEARC